MREISPVPSDAIMVTPPNQIQIVFAKRKPDLSGLNRAQKYKKRLAVSENAKKELEEIIQQLFPDSGIVVGQATVFMRLFIWLPDSLLHNKEEIEKQIRDAF